MNDLLFAVELSEQVLLAWATWVEHNWGLRFGPSRIRRLRAGLSQRLEATNLSADAYWSLVTQTQDSSECQALINELVIGETCFFRHKPSFDYIQESLLPQLLRASGTQPHLRFLSAGCANGAEAMSLAILCTEAQSKAAFSFEIEGIDLHQQAVTEATQGIYSQRQLRGLPDSFLERYFQKQPASNQYRITDTIRNHSSFFCRNIFEMAHHPSPDFDVIYCHNLFIYMSDAYRQKAVVSLTNRLNPGGFLILGPAEMLSVQDPRLKPVRAAQALVFQKSPTPATPHGAFE